MYKAFGKRTVDIICAALALLVFCWLYLLLAILIRIKLGKPVLFRQGRPGKDEKTFHLYKFRTMTNARDANGALLSDTERLTKFGKWLRDRSLDELPEAWNILKGEMSVVGPRPMLIEYLPLYKGRQKLRHSVLPGLTGLAQINGRDALDFETKVALDVAYTEDIRFSKDIKIILATVKKAIIRRDDILYGADKPAPDMTGVKGKEKEPYA